MKMQWTLFLLLARLRCVNCALIFTLTSNHQACSFQKGRFFFHLASEMYESTKELRTRLPCRRFAGKLFRGECQSNVGKAHVAVSHKKLNQCSNFEIHAYLISFHVNKQLNKIEFFVKRGNTNIIMSSWKLFHYCLSGIGKGKMALEYSIEIFIVKHLLISNLTRG